MIKVLWFSRHDLTEEQLDGLRKVALQEFEEEGPVVVEKFDKTVSSAGEIADRVKDHRIVAAVLPVELLAELFSLLGPSGPVIALPRNKRERDGEAFVFRHAGWEIVDHVEFRSHLVK